MPRNHITLSLSLLALLLPACAGQPVSVEPSGQTVEEAPSVYFEADLKEQPGLVPEADTPLVLEVEGGNSQDVVPVQYVRGVEETVSWEGSGQGVAELWNEHGQLVYRVTEGGEPFTGLIPAGRYSLTVKDGEAKEARTLVVEPTVEGTRQQREIFWRADETDRGPGVPSFKYVNLKDKDFSGQDLAGASFSRTNLQNVSFAGAKLAKSRFEGVYLKNCNFDGADLEYAKLENGILFGCSFEGARMRRVNVKDVIFRGGSMRGAVLLEALFSRANLSGVVFEGADLRGIWNLQSRLLDRADDKCGNYPGCGFDGVGAHFKAAAAIR